jgi:hypothetical protein
MEDLDLDGIITVKWIVRVWTGFALLETGPSGGLLWTRHWNFGFHKTQGISWPAERLSASQGLFSVFCNIKTIGAAAFPQRRIGPGRWRDETRSHCFVKCLKFHYIPSEMTLLSPHGTCSSCSSVWSWVYLTTLCQLRRLFSVGR